MKYRMRPAPDEMVEIARRAAAEVEQARVAAAGKECTRGYQDCGIGFASSRQNFGGLPVLQGDVDADV